MVSNNRQTNAVFEYQIDTSRKTDGFLILVLCNLGKQPIVGCVRIIE